jgi:hypothetical protein
MRITIIGDDSISRQARIYAEYRLFAALSQGVDTRRIRSASLVLRRVNARSHRGSVVCTVTVELNGGRVTRVKARGDHACAAINRAVERVRPNRRPVPPHESSPGELVTD